MPEHLQQHLHLLPNETRANAAVSSKSRWGDSSWLLDVTKGGLPKYAGRLHWNIELGEAGNLLEPRWSALLEECRKLTWSVMTDSRSGPQLDPVTIASTYRGSLVKLLRWMTGASYESFSEIDNEASWEYLDHLLDERRTIGKTVKAGVLGLDLKILGTIYRQSSALEDAGLAPMPEAPFDGDSPSKVAETFANAPDGWIPPLPDEVALTILAQCVRWMDQPLQDVISLRDQYLETVPRTRNAQGKRVEETLAHFTFSQIPGEEGPWRPPLGADSAASAQDPTPNTRKFRDLVIHAASACVTLIQGTTGMRISEISALRGGLNKATGLPCCVKFERSKTGINELIYVESQATKIHGGAILRWVIGMRPAGATYLPPAVRAIQRLEELFRPWRDAHDLEWLVVNPGGGSALRRPGAPVLDVAIIDTNAKQATRSFVAKNMKVFVAAHGGLEALPDFKETAEGKLDLRLYKTGKGFRSHQWRKSFALYVLRADPRMLPAIAQHFKHLSLAMTEQGYIGNDPELLSSIDSMRRHRTVKFFLEQASGTSIIAGGMADLVREHRKHLQDVVGVSAGAEAYQRMEAWVLETDLRIWYADHGKCLMSLMPGAARCHTLGGTDPWFKREPNYAQRNPSVCGGCRCFAVDGEHVAFWRNRHDRNVELFEGLDGAKKTEYRVAVERAKQSAAILRTLGHPVEAKEE